MKKITLDFIVPDSATSADLVTLIEVGAREFAFVPNPDRNGKEMKLSPKYVRGYENPTIILQEGDDR